MFCMSCSIKILLLYVRSFAPIFDDKAHLIKKDLHQITSTFITFTSLFHSSLENLHKFPVEKLKVKFFIKISKHTSHQKYNIQVLRRTSNECLIILLTNFFLTLFLQASVLDLLFVE